MLRSGALLLASEMDVEAWDGKTSGVGSFETRIAKHATFDTAHLDIHNILFDKCVPQPERSSYHVSIILSSDLICKSREFSLLR